MAFVSGRGFHFVSLIRNNEFAFEFAYTMILLSFKRALICVLRILHTAMEIGSFMIMVNGVLDIG